ncbi:MAG: hypothetical protein ACF788_11470 [Novipirellula sp. JB048]
MRAAQSIPLNIAEGDKKRSLVDRGRFLDNRARFGARMRCNPGRPFCDRGL